MLRENRKKKMILILEIFIRSKQITVRNLIGSLKTSKILYLFLFPKRSRLDIVGDGLQLLEERLLLLLDTVFSLQSSESYSVPSLLLLASRQGLLRLWFSLRIFSDFGVSFLVHTLNLITQNNQFNKNKSNSYKK